MRKFLKRNGNQLAMFYDVSALEQNLLSWKTSVFGAFCCFQDAYVNMPLQQWEMRPKGQGPNNLIITIISTVAEIELEIKVTAGDLSALQ